MMAIITIGGKGVIGQNLVRDKETGHLHRAADRPDLVFKNGEIITEDPTGIPPTWNPDGDIPYNAIEMLHAISAMADSYDTWYKVGMALHYTDPLDGFGLFDWWSGLSKKYDADAVRRQWNVFSRRQHAVHDPLTFDTIRKWAGEAGWEDPDFVDRTIQKDPKKMNRTDQTYTELDRILTAAYQQASAGKGKERHATEHEPFERQQICEIGRRLIGNKAAGPLFQAVKKIYESGRLPRDRAIAELYGAINYAAAAILILESEKD